MTHDELREEYGAFALGVADEAARIEIAEHRLNRLSASRRRRSRRPYPRS